MKRREFLTALSVAASFPFGLAAQTVLRLYKIGVLWHAANADQEEPYRGWLREGFTELNYVEGKNIIFQEMYPDERPELFEKFARELVNSKVDLLVAVSTPSALAAQKATDSIPIVFLPSPDPVGLGLVQTLSRPGKNITGLSSMGFDVISKRVQFFKEAVPNLRRAALLMSPSSKYDAEKQELEYNDAAKQVGVVVERIEAKTADGLEAAFDEIKKRQFDGVFVSQTPMYFVESKRIASLALANRLPTMTPAETFVRSGAFMSYAAAWRPIFVGVAAYARKILNGEKPGEIPVQQPTKFELAINISTAKSLGLDPATSLLAAADVVLD